MLPERVPSRRPISARITLLNWVVMTVTTPIITAPNTPMSVQI